MKSITELSTQIKVLKTTQYDKFNKLTANREVATKRVTRLKHSIQSRGNLRVLVMGKFNGKLYVIDGQHYLQACINIDIPVFYQIIEFATEADMIDMMAVLNSTSATWELGDYVHAFAELNILDYMRLKAWRTKTGYSVQNISKIASGGEITKVSQSIKNKQFKFYLTEPEMTKMVNMLDKLIEAIAPISYNSINTIVAGFVKYKRFKGTDFNFTLVLKKVREEKEYLRDYLLEEPFYEFLINIQENKTPVKKSSKK